MNSPSEASSGLSPDDALPPVEPPSAGFILQLFVIPAIIVFIIVSVWWMFNWLAQRGNDPASYVRALQRNNSARWQAAVNLASALQTADGSKPQSLKRDAAMAHTLSEMLAKEIETGGMEKDAVMLRMYLARAIGEFAVVDGLPVLIKAAGTERDERETLVRQAAIEALAVRHENLRRFDPESLGKMPLAEIDRVLDSAAEHSDSRVRSAAAFTFGVIGSDAGRGRLIRMADDPYPDVRYNAATALARLGSTKGTETLLEMLDAKEHAGIKIEKEEEARLYKRAMILTNALEAVSQLAARDSKTDLSRLAAAVDKLTGDATVPRSVQLKASALSKELSKRRTPATAKVQVR